VAHATKKRGPGRPPGPSVPFAEIGTTGLKRTSGIVFEEFQKDLRGRRGMKIYREMRDNSPTVGACLGAIENLIRQASWHVESASSDPEDLKYAAHIESCRHDMSFTWSETVGEFLTMLPYGWSFAEIVYKRRLGDSSDPKRRSKFNDGLIGWRKLPVRAQDTLYDWRFDAEGGIQAMRQQDPNDGRVREIPIEKALLFRPRTSKNNPEGISILRNAYYPWFFCKRITEIEAVGIARDLAGVPVGWIPPECFDPQATASQKAVHDAMEKIVRNVARDEQEGLLLPLDYVTGTSNKRFDFTLLTTGGRRQFDTSQIIERYNRMIAMTMFQDLVVMGQPNTIQYKGKKMPELFSVSMAIWLDVIADSFNAYAIPQLMRLNGWPVERAPRLKHGDVEVPDLAALGDYISKLGQLGMPLFDSDWTHLRRVAAMPEGRRPGAAPPPQITDPAGGPDEPISGAGEEEPVIDVVAMPVPADPPLVKRLTDRRPLRLSEFADLTGYSRQQIRKWADGGILKTVKPLGQERRVTVKEAARVARELGIVS
jgi:hypothetical protein